MHGIAWLESIVDSETLIASFEQYGPRQGASVRLAALRSLLAESADEAVELPGARERTPARQTA
jgi:hypothetical protein